ncbi:DUF4351 domain-containing protein [Nostoc sp. LEGE 12450]|uniref:DUF4351 domain-containing protein n=1 Tax=Nostoc sp. LEGE 12450 TaxID=1828643 RepID=UPI002AD2FF34|nr:DUF4351 domain-containing protein [Nostoc sp. LEGE 12450]
MLGLNLEEPRAIREAKEEGQRKVVLRQLKRLVGVIPDALLFQIQELSVEQLEALGDALLDFSSLADLERWLQSQQSG